MGCALDPAAVASLHKCGYDWTKVEKKPITYLRCSVIY